MLAEWVLRNHRQLQLVDAMGLGLGQAPQERLAVLSSTVSSRMLAAIAQQEGIHWAETLTGERPAGCLGGGCNVVLLSLLQGASHLLGGIPPAPPLLLLCPARRLGRQPERRYCPSTAAYNPKH